MPAQASSLPDEILYHFVTKPQAVDELFNSLYERPSELTKQHFMAINAHLDQQVRPGQMVIITPPNAQQCTAFEADLTEVARRIDRQLETLSEEQANVVAENYGLLTNVATYSGAGYGIAVNYFKNHKSQVEYILNEIEKLHVKTYNRYGKFNTNTFFGHRKRLFQQLDTVLKTMVGRSRMGLNIDRSNIKQSLGLSTKSLVHQLKDHPVPISEIPEFEKNHIKVINYGKILKRAGHVGLALDGIHSATKVHQACTTGTEQECTKSVYSEGGRFGGSVAGGALGGLATSYLLCNLVFGLPSGGSSLLWCGIVAGGAGGVVGGNILGGALKEGGETLYENVYSTN